MSTASLAIREEDPYILSVIYNPWNPHSNWIQWDLWNRMNGYNITSTIARLAIEYIDNIDDEDQVDLATDIVVSQILANDHDGIYCKVYENDKTPIVPRET